MDIKRILLFGVLLLTLLLPMPVSAAEVTDNLKEYVVVVEPQSNGDLKIAYLYNWCFLTAYTGNDIFLELGVPNRSYIVESYTGNNVTGARAYNSNGQSNVRVDFDKEFQANECAAFTFTIIQSNMIHAKGEEASFQFKTSDFSSATIESLEVHWKLPADPTQLKSIDPVPTQQNAELAIWKKTDLRPKETLTVNLLYAKAAFTLPAAEAQPVTKPAGEGSSGVSPLLCILGIVIALILVGAFVYWIVSQSSGGGSSDTDYSTGGHIGGYGSGSSSDDDDDDRSSRRSTCVSTCVSSCVKSSCVSSPRSSGGGGSYGGRSSSCVKSSCVSRPSCACACACAGSGRAGCSRKGFRLGAFMEVLNEGKTSRLDSILNRLAAFSGLRTK